MSLTDANALDKLKRQRKVIIANLERFQTFIASVSEDNVSLDIQMRYDDARPLINKFNEIQCEIEELVPLTDLTTEVNEREHFELIYYKALSMAKQLISQNETIRAASVASFNANNQTHKLKLPELQLNTFDGKQTDWANYRDLFKSLIHSNESLSFVDKFQYLKGSLIGDAARVIRSIAVTEQNYTIAWNRLCDRRHIESLSTKLDTDAKRDWERESISIEIPTPEAFCNFLIKRAKLSHKIQPDTSSNQYSNQPAKASYNKFTKQFNFNCAAGIVNQSCPYCQEAHKIYYCQSFISLPVEDRFNYIKNSKRCTNCLRDNHFTKDCKSIPCRTCNKNHHTLLHFGYSNQAITESQTQQQTNSNLTNPETHVVAYHSNFNTAQVILATAIVEIRNSRGTWSNCRALLDPGSQCSMITSNLFKKLNLQPLTTNSLLVGINQASCRIKHRSIVTIKSKHINFQSNFSCLVLDKITENLPTVSFNRNQLNIPENIKLADPDFNKSSDIDVLIGADLFWNLLCVGAINCGSNQPIIQKTKLGWIISGPLTHPVFSNKIISNCSINKQVQTQLEKFWTLESCVNESNNQSKEDVLCENYFQQTTTRDETGRFTVSIPFKENQLSIETKNSNAFISSIIQNDFFVDDLLSGGETSTQIKQIQKETTQLLNTAGFTLRKWVSNDRSIQQSDHQTPINLASLDNQAISKTLGIQWNNKTDSLQFSIQLNSKSRISKRSILSEIAQIFDPLGLVGPCVVLAKIILQRLWQLNLSWDESIPSNHYTQWAEFKSQLDELNQISIPRHALCNNQKQMEIPSQWKQFVANRVTEIQNLLPNAKWNYVPTQDNPADIISRGINPKQLKSCNLWWNGPLWLNKSSNHWPKQITKTEIDIPEARIFKNIALITTETNNSLIERYSSYVTLKRIAALLLRFKFNCLAHKTNQAKLTGHLTTRELENAETALIKTIQPIEFQDEYVNLLKGKPIKPSSKLLYLNPFLDENKIIRVGGRIKNSNYSFNQIHPIILPSKSTLTKLIICNEHRQLLHAGIATTLASVRRKYWPISGKAITKTCVKHCIPCFRANPKSFIPIMGDLPSCRVSPGKPFIKTGVDYAGHFFIKENTSRRSRLVKACIAIFICMATKAVHIELVSSLTTEAFLAALDRFIARRGTVTDLYSDNGTNFIGANNQVKTLSELFESELNGNKIINTLTNKSIQWHFNAPRAPNFGGLWESSVKLVKNNLKRILGDSNLTFELFNTVLIQIEGIINSRPLIPLSNDPNDLSVLTPNHFLIGDSSSQIPHPDITNTMTGRLNQWQRIQQLKQHFWKRWSQEYITLLQGRSKWRKSSGPNPQLGQLVLIKDKNSQPLEWTMGRIIQLHPGKDGINRVVTIHTSSGEMKRPISSVCVFPISDSESDENTN